MIKLLLHPSQIITVDTKGKNLKRGKDLKDLSVLHDHSLLIEDAVIKDFIPESSVYKIKSDKIIDSEKD